MTKKILLSLLLITLQFISEAQSVDSISHYIKSLNHESLAVTPHYATYSLALDNNADKLVILKGKYSYTDLFKHIGQPDKTIAIHAILTKIFQPQNFKISVKTLFEQDTKGNTLYNKDIGYIFQFNGITWQLMSAGDRLKYYIDQKEIQKAKKHWQNFSFK